jgi:hypothetical protein
MQYTSTVPFEGSTEKAFDLAAASLTSIGFQLIARDGSAMELLGPGMMNSRQSALRGASRIQIGRGAGELSIKAELGSVQKLMRFIYVFPIGLIFSLCLFFFILFSFLFDNRQWVVPLLLGVGANALVWVVLSPMMARLIHSRTCKAIDALLKSMAVTGNAV